MKFKSLVLVASSFLIVGCGSGDSIANIFDDAPKATTGIIQINNTTSTNVYQLYFKDEHNSDWGYDMLASDTYIIHNTRVDFTTLLCDKTIDVRATGASGSPIWEIPDVYVECGKTQVVTLTVN